MRSSLKPVLLVAGIVALDQISKFLVLKYIPLIAVINPNGGFSLNIFSINFIIISLISLVFFIVLLKFFDQTAFKTSAFFLIMGGTISNIIDRIFRSGVVDFINFKIWPSFNIADSCIVIGAVLLIIRELKFRDRS